MDDANHVNCAFYYQKLQQKGIESPRNYLAQIAEREVEPHSSAMPSSSSGMEFWGRWAAASAPTKELILGRASAVGATAPLSTSPESPMLGFWATWPLGEVGAAGPHVLVVEDVVRRGGTGAAAMGPCDKGWGSAGGGSAMKRRLDSIRDAVGERPGEAPATIPP